MTTFKVISLLDFKLIIKLKCHSNHSISRLHSNLRVCQLIAWFPNKILNTRRYYKMNENLKSF